MVTHQAWSRLLLQGDELGLSVSIRWRLALAFFAITAAALAAANFFLLNALEQSFIQERRSLYLTHANIVAFSVRGDVPGNPSNLYEVVRNYGSQIDARVLVTDRSGEVLVDSFGEAWLRGRTIGYSEVTTALSGTAGHGVRRLTDGTRVLYAAVPVGPKAKVEGTVLLVASLTDMDAQLGGIRARMVWVSLASAVLAAFLILVIAGRFTQPIAALTSVVHRMAGGDLGERVEVKRRDELGILALAFNKMAEQLQAIDRSRREFVANAAHELRSPLASIRALAQSMVDGPTRDTDEYRECLADIDHEAERLGRLAADLLHLARLDEQQPEIGFVQADAGLLVEDQVRLHKPLALEKGVELHFAGTGNLNGPVSPQLIEPVVQNLVGNAVRYTPPGGKVLVDVELDNGSRDLVLRVSDTGPGIPAEDIPYIFERFYRVDRARSRDTGGTGLGLAIVHRAVALYGGEITVESEPGRGTTFTIRLPFQKKLS